MFLFALWRVQKKPRSGEIRLGFLMVKGPTCRISVDCNHLNTPALPSRYYCRTYGGCGFLPGTYIYTPFAFSILNSKYDPPFVFKFGFSNLLTSTSEHCFLMFLVLLVLPSWFTLPHVKMLIKCKIHLNISQNKILKKKNLKIPKNKNLEDKIVRYCLEKKNNVTKEKVSLADGQYTSEDYSMVPSGREMTQTRDIIRMIMWLIDDLNYFQLYSNSSLSATRCTWVTSGRIVTHHGFVQ